MEFDCRFGLAELPQGNDGGGVEGVDGVIEFQPQVLLGIQGSGQADEGVSEVGASRVAGWRGPHAAAQPR